MRQASAPHELMTRVATSIKSTMYTCAQILVPHWHANISEPPAVHHPKLVLGVQLLLCGRCRARISSMADAVAHLQCRFAVQATVKSSSACSSRKMMLGSLISFTLSARRRRSPAHMHLSAAAISWVDRRAHATGQTATDQNKSLHTGGIAVNQAAPLRDIGLVL